jgi:uncharacterized protein (TIRG00374 family)
LANRVSTYSLIFFSIIYIVILLWLDFDNKTIPNLDGLIGNFYILLLFVAFSFFLRFLRCFWLLRKFIKKSLIIDSFSAYLSGFAYTATPGKIGELVRIRYFNRMGVPSEKVFSAFIYERLFDLIVVFMLCLIGLNDINSIIFSLVFVSSVVVVIIFLALNSHLLSKAFTGSKYLPNVGVFISDALDGLRVWVNPLDMTISLILGILSWSVVSIAFVILTNFLDISLPFYIIFSIYPLAILVGAGSMIPGGFGTTEATIIFLLSIYGISIEVALIAAIGIRISTLWFSILLGFISIIYLEAVNFYKKM